jgi:hypothetical protein
VYLVYKGARLTSNTLAAISADKLLSSLLSLAARTLTKRLPLCATDDVEERIRICLYCALSRLIHYRKLYSPSPKALRAARLCRRN